MNMVKPTHCTDLRLSTLNPPMLNRGVCARVCAEGTKGLKQEAGERLARSSHLMTVSLLSISFLGLELWSEDR